MSQHTAPRPNTLRHVPTHCAMSQHTAPRPNTLRHVSTHCAMSQHTAPRPNTLCHVPTHCAMSQHTVPCLNTLRHVPTHCAMSQHTVPCPNTLRHVPTHCAMSQHTACCGRDVLQSAAPPCAACPGHHRPPLFFTSALLTQPTRPYRRPARAQLRAPDVFDFVEKHALIAELSGARASALLDIDEEAALKLLTRAADQLPPSAVVPAIQVGLPSKFLPDGPCLPGLLAGRLPSQIRL
eukprot:354524-Chlamydomonas_euryale.AAC.2